MAVTAAQVAVDDDPIVALNTATIRGVRLYIKNMGAEPAYLGPSDVAAGDGYEMLEDEAVEVTLEPREVLYAISTASGTTLSVLRS